MKGVPRGRKQGVLEARFACAPKRLCFRVGRRKATPFDFLLYCFLYYELAYLFRSYLPKNNRNSDTKGLRFLCFYGIIFLERRVSCGCTAYMGMMDTIVNDSKRKKDSDDI